MIVCCVFEMTFISASVQTIRVEWNVSPTISKVIDVRRASRVVVVWEEIRFDRMTSCVSVQSVIQSGTASSTLVRSSSLSEAETESNIRQFGSVRFDSVESNRTEPRFRQIRSNRIESNQVGSRSESNRTELLQSWAEPNRTEPIKSNPALTNTCSAASPPLVIKHIDLKDSLQSNFLFDQMNILRSLVRPPLSDTATWAKAHQRLSVFLSFHY